MIYKLFLKASLTTMFVEIPMKVRKSRTPPCGLPHSLELVIVMLYIEEENVNVAVIHTSVLAQMNLNLMNNWWKWRHKAIFSSLFTSKLLWYVLFRWKVKVSSNCCIVLELLLDQTIIWTVFHESQVPLLQQWCQSKFSLKLKLPTLGHMKQYKAQYFVEG